MNTAAGFSRVLGHVYGEPRFRAEMEWRRDHPGLSIQLEQQVGRDALERFAAGAGWAASR
jgi:hypothetical protein